MVLVTTTSLKGILWLSEPWWSTLIGKKKELSMTVEPLAIIEGGKNKKIESEIVTYMVAARLNQINKVLSTDLPLPKESNQYYVLEGVSQPKYDSQAKVSKIINFKLRAFEIDIGGLLNYLQSSLDQGEKLHGTLTLDNDNTEIIIALETSDTKHTRGPWRLKANDKSLQEIIEEVSHQIAFDTHKMFNPQLKGLTYKQFQSFIEGLRSYQEYVFISAELERETEAQAHLNNAKKIFQQLADRQSQCSLVYSYLASILSISPDSRKVIEPVISLLEKAIKLDPSNSFALSNIDEFRKIRDTQFTELPDKTLDQLKSQPVFQNWGLSQISSGPHEVKVAVLSTGIDTSIKLLADRITNAKSFVPGEEIDDNHGHGTSVAGLLAVIAPQVKIIPVKTLSDSGGGTLLQTLEGIEYAIAHKADIILVPLGHPSDNEAEKQVYASARKNALVIASGGNNSSNSIPGYPAAYESVLGVGATELDGKRASFSDYGNWITLFSPGVNIQTLWPQGQAKQVNGTSYAATIVAAVAALMKSYNPKFTPNDLQEILKDSSTKFTDAQLNLNVQNAIKKAQE